jgi:predicted acetyltransferase
MPAARLKAESGARPMHNSGMDGGDEARDGIRLVWIPASERGRLRALMTTYLVEFAALEGIAPGRDAEGHVPYRYFEPYWQEPERIPFWLLEGGRTVGFCLLRDTGRRWQIAEFYVAPEFRRRGAGSRAVATVAAYCRRDGRHRYLEATTQSFNPAARAFWRRQGFVTIRDADGEQENVLDLATDEASADAEQ